MERLICMVAAFLVVVGLLAGCAQVQDGATTGSVGETAGAGTTAGTTEATGDRTEPTERVTEYPIDILEPETIPTIEEEERDVTPEEFAEVLQVENIAPFTGAFMECEPEDIDRRENVHALRISNISDKTMDKITLTYNDGSRDLVFCVEMLPAGWTIVAMDQEGSAVESATLTYVSGSVEYLEEGREVKDEVDLIETVNSTIIVKNMTDETMAHVVVYYRNVDHLGNILAGRCFRATSEELIPGWEEELETERWLPSCVIVNVVVLDEAGDAE